MMERAEIFQLLGLLVIGAPAGLFAVLGFASLFIRRPLSELAIFRLTQFAISVGLAASCALLGLMLVFNDQHVPIAVGSWVHIENNKQDEGTHSTYHFVFKFVFDRLSIPFVILTFVLSGTVSAFSNRYMHRDQGYNRFFLLFSLFVTGMITTSTAETVETLFSGWELVGLSSALLIAFFHERPNPVKNALHVWIVYRISDAALLLAAIILHNVRGEGDFDCFMSGQWPNCETRISADVAFLVGLLLLLAAMGKSAMIPFSGWLPRAMEGPTPSSAVFYGALSVHLGAFLLLRFSSLLYRSPTLQGIIVIVGLATAVAATFQAEVQTDVKSALSFASMAQVGIIFVEIGLGLQYLAILHIAGHGCLRTLQFLRAPTLLHDYREMENAIGANLSMGSGDLFGAESAETRNRYYLLTTERLYLDSFLQGSLFTPLLDCLKYCDRLEQRWIKFLRGGEQLDSPSSGTTLTQEDFE